MKYQIFIGVTVRAQSFSGNCACLWIEGSLAQTKQEASYNNNPLLITGSTQEMS